MRAILIASLLLAGCTAVATVKKAVPAIRASVERTNDKKMDTSRAFVCGNTYRAEIEAVARWNLTGGDFKNFCGRQNAVTR